MRLLTLLAIAAVLASTEGVAAVGLTTVGTPAPAPLPAAVPTAHARAETAWIFDADFEDLVGDNAGWLGLDRSGTPASENFWHKDTLFTDMHPSLGESAWWCGVVNGCFEQGQGYGNNWTCCLERDFPLAEWTEGGADAVELQFAHRYAMEKSYDYGYVDVSTDGGSNWTTKATYTNTGFVSPGWPVDWHTEAIDMTEFSESDVRLRFRFESDVCYSSEDQPDNPDHSVKDGAWQLDNFAWNVLRGVWATPWEDDCEDPGENGWEHEDTPGVDQTGVYFRRHDYHWYICTNHDSVCNDIPDGSRIYAAVDEVNWGVMEDEDAWLVSPPIDISGAQGVVGQWEAWVDCPHGTQTYYDLWLNADDIRDCVRDLDRFVDEEPGYWYGGPTWDVWTDDWSHFAGNDWLAVNWRLWVEGPHEPGKEYMGGFFLNRMRVGVVTDFATEDDAVWEVDRLYRDWFDHELAAAASDYARVRIYHPDGIDYAGVMVYSDAVGWLWYGMTEDPPGSGWWRAPAPLTHQAGGGECLWHFNAANSSGTGGLWDYPPEDPEQMFEFSILPMGGDILLVDDSGELMPGAAGRQGFTSQYYYEEALSILGHTWDRYDVGDPLSDDWNGHGPGTAALGNYNTVIWFTGNRDRLTLQSKDQIWLTEWLQSGPNHLLLTGNDLAYDVDHVHGDPNEFFAGYLHAAYQGDGLIDTDVLICDEPGGEVYLNECHVLSAGCPAMPEFDRVEPADPAADVAMYYERSDSQQFPAAVTYSNNDPGFSTIVLGFGLEYMVDGGVIVPRGETGLAGRVGLLEAVMEEFDVEPSGQGTGVADASENRLSHARPNPFNPTTSIEYSIKAPGRVRIRVFDLAGRVVRTLVDEERAAPGGAVAVWDGRDESGKTCASGVYFYGIEAPGFKETRRMTLLK